MNREICFSGLRGLKCEDLLASMKHSKIFVVSSVCPSESLVIICRPAAMAAMAPHASSWR